MANIEIKIIRILITLGIPGIVLWLFFSVLPKIFSFNFETITATCAGIIAGLIIISMVIIVLFALHKYAPNRNKKEENATNFKLPSCLPIVQIFSACPLHGELNGEHKKCPICTHETEIYSGVNEHLRSVTQWNDGKQSEFSMRKTFKVA